MNLRRKLFTVFGGLGLLALATVAVTLWSTAQWQATEKQLKEHYQRSLLLQRVRASTFRATREISDALMGSDSDAIEEFKSALEPVEQDFQQWAALAESEAEKQQVEQIYNAYQTLIQDANRVFQLLESGRRVEAVELAEGQLEQEDFRRFETLTEAAVASDQSYRQVVRQSTQNARQTAQLVLGIAAFGILSLILLLAAYLVSDLFVPLWETEQALDEVAQGNLQRQLDENRQDELGAIHRAFNRMVEAIAQREQFIELAAMPAQVAANETQDGLVTAWSNIPSRLTLHVLVSQLRSRLTQLHQTEQVNNNGHVTVAVQQKQDVIEQLDQLLQAITRITEFGFPLDLNLARTDIRALLYEVLLRFHEDFVRRRVSYELQIAPEIGDALVDRLKLREALGELVRNALAAFPEQGGSLGVRATQTPDGEKLLIEVADDGNGAEQPLINQAFNLHEASQTHCTSVGLKLTRAIVEQHGGQFVFQSKPNQGTFVQIYLPLRI